MGLTIYQPSYPASASLLGGNVLSFSKNISVKTPNNYIIGLIPAANDFNLYFDSSKQLCTANNAGYLLSLDKSLPHITLCQVITADEKSIDEIWHLVDKFTFSPEFYGFHTIPGTGEYAGSFWLELSAKRDKPLLAIHQEIKKHLEQRGLVCANASDDYYRPHLTLGRVSSLKDISLQDFPVHLIKKGAPFSLIVAKADVNWQCNQILHGAPLSPPTLNKLTV
jgi:2'-5' RNA ligase